MPRSKARIDRVSQVTAYIEKAIQKGDYGPGDPLPAEREIASQLKVSRSVVREAIGRLASVGLVQSVHGSGTRVQAPSGKPIVEGFQRLLQGGEVRLEQLAAVRLPLEATIAELAAAERRVEHLGRMEQSQAVLADPRSSLEEQVRADLEFHAALADATGNPLFKLVLAPIQELLITSRRVTLGRYGAEIVLEHHGRILDAVRKQDCTGARNAMAYHLKLNVEHLRRGLSGQTT